METTYTYKLQGNNKESWTKIVTDNNIVIEKEMFYGDINEVESDAIIIGNNPQHTLDIYKKRKKKLIDKKTEALLINGFTFNSLSFGLRENEKTKWLALYRAPLTKYPINLVSKEGATTQLNAANIEPFYDAAFDRARFIEEQGGLLKYQVNQCTTVAQVEAIIDNRI